MNDARDAEIARLKSDNTLLRSTVAWYIRAYERWEEAVSDILGRKPETGLHIQRARDCLNIVGWPEEQEKVDGGWIKKKAVPDRRAALAGGETREATDDSI